MNDYDKLKKVAREKGIIIPDGSTDFYEMKKISDQNIYAVFNIPSHLLPAREPRRTDTMRAGNQFLAFIKAVECGYSNN